MEAVFCFCCCSCWGRYAFLATVAIVDLLTILCSSTAGKVVDKLPFRTVGVAYFDEIAYGWGGRDKPLICPSKWCRATVVKSATNSRKAFLRCWGRCSLFVTSSKMHTKFWNKRVASSFLVAAAEVDDSRIPVNNIFPPLRAGIRGGGRLEGEIIGGNCEGKLWLFIIDNHGFVEKCAMSVVENA